MRNGALIIEEEVRDESGKRLRFVDVIKAEHQERFSGCLEIHISESGITIKRQPSMEELQSVANMFGDWQ